MQQYVRKIDANGQEYLETDLAGYMLTRSPLLNKGTAFTMEERKALGLLGTLPPHVTPLSEQVQQSYAGFKDCKSPIDKHVFLRLLQDRNEVLFYALVAQHLEEMMPIIYTPTVGEAIEKFSHIFRHARGLIISTENIDYIDSLLENTPLPDVKLVVASDAEAILGIGDQGVGGLGICIGKLSLYTAAAGIDPAFTLPVGVDIGTNRQDLLDDPLYLGVRHKRLEGKAYMDFIEKFVTAFKKRFPSALLQWEDFSKQKAFDVLDRFQDVVPSFNDDIQGTGAVVLAGLLASMRKIKQRLSDQVFVIHGAGAGGVGVARQICLGMELEGTPFAAAKERMLTLDSKGLVLSNRSGLEPYKLEFALDPQRIAGWKTKGAIPDLLETVQQGKVTALIGLSGQRNAFPEEIVRAVAKNTPNPIVFALSNPTANCEVEPADVYRWTDGKAIVATGSPYADVSYGGKNYPVGQGNNAFIFPGLGLGVMLSGARQVTEKMLTVAAMALNEFTTDERIAQGGVYPRVEQIREASKHVAVAVIKQAIKDGLARNEVPEKNLDAFVESGMWRPEYLPIRRKRA
ncbi:MAG: NAD-dependent malic enzyme [Deltaproteobacteria bacterium]|nr:NAD-dependent malic enzyme [Deltaproteobacteria bacterium]